jgi:hypothetical protein
MRILTLLFFLFSLLTTTGAFAVDVEHAKTIAAWRDKAEKSLRSDNGWLTLAGRYVMKPGTYRIGTAAGNDLVFPAHLGPPQLGTLEVAKGKVTLRLAEGVIMTALGKPFSGERAMKTDLEKRDWVALGSMSFHVIEREGTWILRLADNESAVRKQFAGRDWYNIDEAFRVEAKFVPYPKGRKMPIVNVLDEISDEPSPGYIEFSLAGQTQRLDVVGEDEGLFFVFRDMTAGDTTYRPGRFLYIEKMPKPDEKFTLDFNKAYNPPCAFSEFTTCPLPPEQNRLKVRIEAGEKYRAK